MSTYTSRLITSNFYDLLFKKQTNRKLSPAPLGKTNIVKVAAQQEALWGNRRSVIGREEEKKNREICPWQTQMVTERGRRERKLNVKGRKKRAKKNKITRHAVILDEVEKAKCATLLHLHINELISKHAGISALLQKLPSKHKPWKCS